jgi:hypothetical protein
MQLEVVRGELRSWIAEVFLETTSATYRQDELWNYKQLR